MRSHTLLYAEDDEHYARLFECTLKQGGFKHRLQIVGDGAEAIAYIKGEGKYSDRSQFPFPTVVLADLKMPRINGFELLDWIRRMSSFPHLPVVILTSSDEQKEIHKAYAMGANSFLVKPPVVEDLKEMLQMLDGYWLKFNQVESLNPAKPLRP